MLLKYLELQGFKSFPDKTKVTFGQGLTAVVGPNGSGKSNISDAVRWVMGEQSTKTLRGNKMEDVIFTGTKTRKSQGFAEVSLTVDNSKRELAIDSDDVTITRRYDRSGESEYMINRSNVRLKDIQETLMDTGLGKDGYSLVGQGKIAEIVQSKSNERREIFEEAAGISKFRHRKNESERNLERAEENLVRLRDILSELEGRVAPLKEQSEKAKQFLSLSDKKRTLEISIWIDTLERSNLNLKDQGDKIMSCNVECEDIESQIEDIEAQIQQTFSDMQDCLVSGDKMRTQKAEIESDISQITSQIAVCENNLEHNKTNLARIEAQIADYAKSVSNVNDEINDKLSEVEKIKAQIVVLDGAITQKQAELLEKSQESENFSEREKELSDNLNKLLLHESQIKMSIDSALSNIDELKETIQKNQADRAFRQEENEKYTKELSDANELVEILNVKAQELGNTYAGHKMKLDNRNQKLNDMKLECDKADLLIKEKEQKVRLLEGMEQSLDGFVFSVKEVIKKSKNGVLNGIHGTVSQIISVKNEYAVAIETALGGAMQNIVVENESDAKSAIRLLKQENLGRATFLPITSVSGNLLTVQGLDRYVGYVGIASELVSYQAKYEPIIMSLLARIVIVEDIDTAVLIAQKNGYRFKIVTLDGQVVNAGGSLTGGSRNKGQSFLSRKNEISDIREELVNSRQKLAKNRALMESVAVEAARIQAEFTAVASEITTLNEDKIRVSGECKRLDQLLFQSTQMLADMSSELSLKSAKQRLLSQSVGEMEVRLKEISGDISKTSLELNSLQTTNQSVVSVKTTISDEISALNIDNIALSKDIEALESSILSLRERKDSSTTITDNLEQEIKQTLTLNEEILQNITQLSLDITDKRDMITDINKRIDETLVLRQQFEAKSTGLRKDERDISQKKEKLSAQRARLEEKKDQIQRDYDDIISKLWNEYELVRSEAQQFAVNVEDTSKATNELNAIRSKIRSLGSVNVDAIEEYKEVSERYEFLNAQISDSEKSRNELLKLINELTQKMQDIFAENFQKINENFQKIFVDLFGGGSAQLKLTDPDNLLESGIEIFVEPPGKIIKNLASLSGGEQSFVAIAIYFAILKVRPAPFCILDEIEAALDDVNVDKYASYLRSMSDKTQFIMITHRRGSMEAADILYGVTMQDEGVSKLLELNVSEIESKLKLKV